MENKQQGNPKRYQVEFAVKAALMEDALSGNLGQATTEFLNAIGLIDKKGNPVELTGESKTFYQKPMLAAYYALHMVGIKDDRKMYKEKSKEDKDKKPTLKQALKWVS